MTQPMTVQMMREALDAVQRAGSTTKAAPILGLSESTVRRRVQKAQEMGITLEARPEAGQAFMSETELRMKIDIGLRLETAAKSIPDGSFIPESEFLQAHGLRGKVGPIINTTRFSVYRGLADNRVVYWGNPKDIARLKAEHLLRSAEI